MKFCPQCGHPLQTRQIDGVSRLACAQQKCQYVYWNNPVPVVAALVEYDGKFIIARNVQWPKRIYSLISGYLEAKESPQQAVVREVKEELGLNAKLVRHIGNYAFVEKNQLILAYAVQAWGTLQTNHELADARLLTRDEFAAYDFSPLTITQQILADWKNLNQITT
jgi:NAD+ diphosphatase